MNLSNISKRVEC